MVVLSDSLLAASLSASNSQFVFWDERSDSIFLILVSTFLRSVSTVSFDRPGGQLVGCNQTWVAHDRVGQRDREKPSTGLAES